jgi:hypothetical protein
VATFISFPMTSRQVRQDPVFVPHANQINIGEIQEFGSAAVGAGSSSVSSNRTRFWIAVFGVRIIHRKCEQPLRAELGGNRIT